MEIASVDPDSAAARAGLRPGDILRSANQREAVDAEVVEHYLAEREARAEPVSLGVERDGWQREVTLAPAQPPSVAARTDAVQPVPIAPRASSGDGEPARAAPPSAADVAPVVAGASGDVVADVKEANRFYEAGNWSEAETYYKRVLAALPNEARSWARLCHSQLMQQRFADAAKTCEAAAKRAPDEPSIYQNAGYSLSRLGRAADAVPWYRRAIELAPNEPLAYSSLGAAYVSLHEWGKAEESFRAMLAHDPTSPTGWQSLGDVAGELGKPAEAVAHYRKALSLGASNADLYRGLGWQLYRDGKLNDADAALREANRQNPKDVNTLVTLGIVADKLGKPAEAREAWQRAVELEPDSALGAIARRNLAIVEGKLGPRPGAAVAASPPPRQEPPKTGIALPEQPRVITEPESETGL